MVAILGPNGAGKTSLLRAVAGLLPLDAGRVVLDDAVLADTATRVWVPPERRAVSMMFQEVLLFPHLSVRDNVAFGLRARGARKRVAAERAERWLDQVGLSGRGADRPGRLSGGERQRVALARALVTEPRLLLLDEPFAAADVSARADLGDVLRAQLAPYTGVSLLVTHDPGDALALADRVVVLESGQVTQEGTLADVRARSGSGWTATMLNSAGARDGRLGEGRWR
jgi:molybdate transport system ATP-binding protein